MAEIIDLDELVPDDIVFKYRGQQYTMAGDIDTETVFRLFRMYAEFAEENEDADAAERTTIKVKEFLLQLFQQRMPDLEALPFGVKSMPLVMQQVLSGLGVDATADPPPPPPPAPGGKTSTKRTRTGAAAKTRTSPRSRGSRSS